jgi:hypothetical protein
MISVHMPGAGFTEYADAPSVLTAAVVPGLPTHRREVGQHQHPVTAIACPGSFPGSDFAGGRAAGLIETPTLIARALALQRRLTETQWASGFSATYAAAGIGYGGAGLLAAPLLAGPGPRFTIAFCALLSAVAAVAGGLAEAHASRR